MITNQELRKELKILRDGDDSEHGNATMHLNLFAGQRFFMHYAKKVTIVIPHYIR